MEREIEIIDQVLARQQALRNIDAAILKEVEEKLKEQFAKDKSNSSVQRIKSRRHLKTAIQQAVNEHIKQVQAAAEFRARVSSEGVPLAILLQEMLELDSSIITSEFLDTIATWKTTRETCRVHGEIATTVAPMFYGEEYVGEQEILEQTARLKGIPVGEINNIARTSGFERLFQVSSGLTDEQYLFIEMLVAQTLCARSLKHLDADEPDLFLTATSMPVMPYFEQHIARAVGITNEEIVPKPYLKACDSSGSAFYDVLTGTYDDLLWRTCPQLSQGKPAVITLFAFEDGFRFSDQGGDQYSAQVFSSGAVAWSFLYHPNKPELSTFKHVVGNQMAVKEGTECLRYKDTTANWPMDAIDPNKMAPHLTEPDDNQAVQMDPKMTPIFFKKHGIRIAKDVWQQFKERMEAELSTEAEQATLSDAEVSAKIKKVIVHHPSKTIFNHVKRALAGRKSKPGLGFTAEQIQWVITEGNTPVTTIPIAFGRQLQELSPGDYVMFLSYGAGGSFTCQVVQIQ